MRHNLSYTIAFTIRSGSNLLCDLLSRNGLGQPAEYFQAPLGSANAYFYDVLGVSTTDFRAFIERLVGERSQNGVFASKVTWDHKNALIDLLARTFDPSIAALDDFFPNHRWLYLRRRDRFAQAVSAWTAQETGVWSSNETTTEVGPDYDFFGIFTVFFSLLVEDYLWDSFFEQSARPPLRIWYEDFVEEPGRTLTEIRRGLYEQWDIEPPNPETPVVASRFTKQANGRSEAFAERFADDLNRIGAKDYWRPREEQLGNWLRFFRDRGWNGSTKRSAGTNGGRAREA